MAIALIILGLLMIVSVPTILKRTASSATCTSLTNACRLIGAVMLALAVFLIL